MITRFDLRRLLPTGASIVDALARPVGRRGTVTTQQQSEPDAAGGGYSGGTFGSFAAFRNSLGGGNAATLAACYAASSYAKSIVRTHMRNGAAMAPFQVVNPDGEVDPEHRNSEPLRTWHRGQTAALGAAFGIQAYHCRGVAPFFLYRPNTPAAPLPTEMTEQPERLLVPPESIRFLSPDMVGFWRDKRAGGDDPAYPTSYRLRKSGGLYKTKADGGTMTDRIPLEDLCEWKTTNYQNEFEPVPVIDDAITWIDLDGQTALWQKFQVENGYRFEVRYKGKGPGSEVDKLRSAYDDKHAGRPGGIFDDQNGTMEPLQNTVKEADWLNTRKHIGEMVSLGLNYPAYLLTDDSSAESNVERGEIDLQKEAFRLMLEIASCLQTTMFSDEEIRQGWRLMPDISGVSALQENTKAQAETAEILVKAGWDTAQASAAVGLVYVAPENPNPPEDPHEDPADEAVDDAE